MNGMAKEWLVEFITMCADGETASQINGVEQLRESAWQLLTKGRTGELEKENFEEIRSISCRDLLQDHCVT